MSTELDWSLSVGIRYYPDRDFGDLEGPELDAEGFHAWVTAESGGGIVDSNRARLIVSSQFKPPFASATKAKPTVEVVNDFFTELDDIRKENEKSGLGSKIGRRLYLYFSGHGYLPAVAQRNEIGMLMANATMDRLGHHVLARAWADLFASAGYFREVLLFMDCCRNEFQNTPLLGPFMTAYNDPSADPRYFYAYATKAKRMARERKTSSGEFRGVFTAALLAGLWGGAADPDTGEIRGSDLKAFLYQNMSQFLAEEDKNRNDIPQEPDVWPTLSPKEDFLICKAEPQKFTVKLIVSSAYQGRSIQIRCNNKVKARGTAKGMFWEVPLSCGVYSAEIVDGPDVPFEVKHPGFDPPGVQEVRLG